jgi:hypothetical protein
VFENLNDSKENKMKSLATIFAALFLSFMSLAAAPSSSESSPIYASKGMAMHFRGSNYVKAGSTISVELNSTFEATAELSVENTDGKQFVDTGIEIEKGVNVLKFNVSDIPSGVYFVKVKTDSKTETLTFVVQ